MDRSNLHEPSVKLNHTGHFDTVGVVQTIPTVVASLAYVSIHVRTPTSDFILLTPS